MSGSVKQALQRIYSDLCKLASTLKFVSSRNIKMWKNLPDKILELFHFIQGSGGGGVCIKLHNPPSKTKREKADNRLSLRCIINSIKTRKVSKPDNFIAIDSVVMTTKHLPVFFFRPGHLKVITGNLNKKVFIFSSHSSIFATLVASLEKRRNVLTSASCIQCCRLWFDASD